VYTYDALGRLSQLQDASGNITAYGYDVLGRTIVVTNPLGQATRTFYDFAGRVVSTTNALSDTTTTLYDALGRALRTQDARGYWTEYQYDRLGRTVVMTDATSAVLRTQYDRAGNRIKTTDALSHTTVYTYDVAGRLIAQVDPLGNTTRYTYDVAGNRSQTIDANGVATGYGYDSLDRLIVVSESLTSTLGLDPARYNVVTRYGYDALGNRTVMTNARGYTTTYEYDALSRLSKTQDARGKATAYRYDALGNRSVMTDANGEVTLYAYDALNRPSLITYTADGQTVHFAYDAVGNRTVMTDSLGTTHYEYDELQRLTLVTDPFTGTVQYVYDANGNRTQLIYPAGKVVTYTYDAGNRLGSVIDWAGQTTTYQYDQAGRLSAVRMPNGIETAYTYDAANRLIRLTHLRNSIEMIGDYQFVLDGVGNRLVVTETLLPPGTGGQLGALPPTFAAEVLAAVTGLRAPGLSAPLAPTTTLANIGEYPLASAPLRASSTATEILRSAATTADRPTTDPAEPTNDQALFGRFASDEQRRETLPQEAPAPTTTDAQHSHPTAGVLAPLAQGGSGLDRREENNASITYGPSAWTRSANNRLSRGYYNGTNIAGRTASLTFTGSWVGLGFLTTADGGQARVYLDGVSQGVIDTYSRDENVTSVYYRNLVSGTHTISLTVLSTKHANSTGTWVRLDYIDLWAGTPPTGRFEENDSRVITSTNWTRDGGYAGASGGYYYRDGSNVWFGFEGDTVTYQAVARTNDGEVAVIVDGQTRAFLTLKNSATITRVLSLDNLGAGPHVLQISAYRDSATVDAFITPGSAPYYQPPTRSGVIRYEEDDPMVRYGAGWLYSQRPSGWSVTKDVNLASDGYYVSASAAGQTVTLVFTGTWAGFGYVATADSGQISVTLDGIDRGVVDAYARLSAPQSVYYNNLASGTHTLTLRVLSTRHPHSTGTNFRFDYFDVWDGSDVPTGTFETPPAYAGAGSFGATWNWTLDTTYAGASNGSFSRNGTAMWQAFTGDAITYQAIARNADGEAEVSIDGQVQGYLNLKNSATITRTFSFGNLSSGPHVLQVRAYRDAATVDAFITPGTEPYYQPPSRSGVIRYEEDDPIIRYGVNAAYRQRPSGWSETKDASLASDGYYVSASAAGQTMTLVFTGTWLGLGYVATTDSGQISVTLDGVDRGIVDAYARFNMPQSVYYNNLASGTHTLTLRVLSTRHPHSSGTNFRFDYFDVWDGSAIATGAFETPFATTWGWTDNASGVASGGRYFSAGGSNAVWQAFTGDSITYQGLASTSGGEVEVRIDGQVQGYVNLRNSTTITRPFSFGSLNSGPHVLQVRAYRGTATVDAFSTPGSAPYYQPPTRSGIARYEEDDSTIRYGLNAPYLQMPQVWEAINDSNLGSDGYYLRTNSVGQTVTLPFTGTWLGFGYLATSNSGQVTITLDGVQLGVLDAYAPTNMQRSWYTAGLSSGVHTLTLKLSPVRNASSSGTYFNIDYFDQWDGALLPAGRSETPFATTWNWTDNASGIASGGRYYSAGSSNAMWHAFTSDAVTYQALTSNSTVTVEISIDGITRGLVSLYNPTAITRTFDYGGLGIGPHMLQVRAVNGTATVDAFITAAFFPTATQRTVITYAYDPLYRLTKADSTGALTTTFEYAYDPVGNRTVQTAAITSTVVTAYQYDAANRLTSVNGQAYTWDDNGNLVNDGAKTYTYNQANQLTNISGTGLTWSASYNGEGARLKQIANGAPTTYTLDLAAPLVQVLVAEDSSGDTRYLYGVTRIGEQQSAGWLYHLTDALGSVRQLADDSSNVLLARGYTPYGEPLWLNGTASSRYAFTGEDYDPTVGLVFLRARYMQPTLGIFLARDPWSGDVLRPGSMNGWNYGDDNPVNRVDPSGRFSAVTLARSLGYETDAAGLSEFLEDLKGGRPPLHASRSRRSQPHWGYIKLLLDAEDGDSLYQAFVPPWYLRQTAYFKCRDGIVTQVAWTGYESAPSPGDSGDLLVWWRDQKNYALVSQGGTRFYRDGNDSGLQVDLPDVVLYWSAGAGNDIVGGQISRVVDKFGNEYGSGQAGFAPSILPANISYGEGYLFKGNLFPWNGGAYREIWGESELKDAVSGFSLSVGGGIGGSTFVSFSTTGPYALAVFSSGIQAGGSLMAGWTEPTGPNPGWAWHDMFWWPAPSRNDVIFQVMSSLASDPCGTCQAH
jgi:RHS repeat-associated protein